MHKSWEMSEHFEVLFKHKDKKCPALNNDFYGKTGQVIPISELTYITTV